MTRVLLAGKTFPNLRKPHRRAFYATAMGFSELEHSALAATARGVALSGSFAVIGGEMARLVLLTRAAPAAVVATENRYGLLLGAQNLDVGKLFRRFIVAILRGRNGRSKRRELSRRA